MDGVDVYCLGDVLLATQKAAGPFIVFSFGGGKKLVLQLDAAREANAKLMLDHGVARDASAAVYAAAAKGPLPVGGGGGGGAGATA